MLVWTKAPMLFRNELVPADGLAGEARAAEPGEVKRVGSDSVIVPLAADGGERVEIAAAGDDRGRALGLLAFLRRRLRDKALAAPACLTGLRAHTTTRGSLPEICQKLRYT